MSDTDKPATMGNEETVILKKLVADKANQIASASIEEGHYEFDISLNVKGKFHREKDYDTLQVNKIDTWLLLAVAFSKLNGVTMDDIIKKATEDPTMEELAKDLKERSKEGMKALKAPTQRHNNGAVKMKELITEVTHSRIKQIITEKAEEKTEES